MTAGKRVTVHFKALFILDVTVEPAGSGTIVQVPDGETFPYGTVVTLTAIPSPGYFFVRWEGDVASLTATASVNLDSDKTVVARFAEPQIVDISISGTRIFPPPPIFAFNPMVIVLEAGTPYQIRFSNLDLLPHTFRAERWGLTLTPLPGLAILSAPFRETESGDYPCFDSFSGATCVVRVEP